MPTISDSAFRVSDVVTFASLEISAGTIWSRSCDRFWEPAPRSPPHREVAASVGAAFRGACASHSCTERPASSCRLIVASTAIVPCTFSQVNSVSLGPFSTALRRISVS